LTLQGPWPALPHPHNPSGSLNTQQRQNTHSSISGCCVKPQQYYDAGLVLQLTEGCGLSALQLSHCQMEDEVCKLGPLNCAIGVCVNCCRQERSDRCIIQQLVAQPVQLMLEASTPAARCLSAQLALSCHEQEHAQQHWAV
jgi:hypothetical protein